LTEQVVTGVGAELKRAREAAGLAIDEAAQRLKLLPRQIESLEHERFDRLPGPAIARGMVRNYARLLKLDPEPLVERMAPRADRTPTRGTIAGGHREQLPSSTTSRRSTLLYAAFSVALLALVGAAAYKWQQEKAAPEPAARAEPKPVEKPVARPVDKPPASEESRVALAPPKPPAAEPEAKDEAPVTKPKPQAAAERAVAPGIHRLVLRMEADAWVEVRDGAGRSLVSSLNPAGSERTVRGQPPFQVVVGNAAGVTLTYDGKPVDLKPYIRGDVARLTLK
jgi:cytoskeleton protein RodZ